MKILDFINEVKAQKIMNTQYQPHAVEKFIKEKLNVKTYVPFAEKRELCKSVLDASCKINGSIVEIDSVSRYILFTIAIISKYTELEFSSGKYEEFDPIDEYDMLCQNDLLNPILDVLGMEYTTCNNILNMMMADINANNNNIAAVLNNSAQKLLDIVDEFKDVLSDKVKELNLDLSQVNIDKYAGIIEKFIQK